MKGKVAFITGGANGIGRASAKALLELGVNVAILDINEQALNEAVEELKSIGPEIMPIKADLAMVEELDGVFNSAVKKFGRVDYLINSAACLVGSYDFLKESREVWDRVIQINLTMPMFLMQRFLRHVVERGGGGRVVMVTSAAAFRAVKNRPAYAASKAGVTSLVRIAAAQMGAYDINVNAVAPGTTSTHGTTVARNVDKEVLSRAVSSGPSENFFKRVSEPEDVASAVAYLCHPGSRQITGQTIHVSAGTITP